jgi:polysaccharide export outer membrane protein
MRTGSATFPVAEGGLNSRIKACICESFALVVFAVAFFFCVSTVFAANGGSVSGAATDYIIGPQDVLEITVWDNKDLSGRVSVSLEGYITYQLVGKVRAAGLSAGEVANKITLLLADGYIVNPQVAVEVVEYKSQKVFIIGEAVKSGTYYLTKETTIVEAISMAGGPTKDADREVIVVRPKMAAAGGAPASPVDPGEGEQIKADLRSALEGDLSQNIIVRSGDSIFIPKAKTFFIMGEVSNPGEYKLDRGTTVRKAISLSGGATDTASIGRTKVIRVVGDKEVESSIDLDEPVLPNDTIVVPESIF